jgi:ABC-type sugar transport system ATPase subunit
VYVTHDQIEAMSMGDRIAVMHEGVMQQVGKPGEVYENPANLFVANFIGSPGMNFIDVVCTKNDHTTKAAFASDKSIFTSFSSDLLKKLKEKDAFDKTLVLGIRPEWVKIEKKKTKDLLPAEVYVIEPLGSSKIIDLRIGGEILKSRVSADFDARIGDKRWVELVEKKVHFFDKQSGNTLYNV